MLNIEPKIRNKILRNLKRKRVPQLVIIDGVDGVGKSTLVYNLIKEWEKQGLKVRFNTFKFRRQDDELFSKPEVDTEYLFRIEVVKQINRRMIEWTDKDIIIMDKSPYSEYFYQKTRNFDRGLIMPYGEQMLFQEVFKYKDIIDNAIVIFLENEKCWENYIGRETKKIEGAPKTSYETLSQDQYMDMVYMFNETRCYANIEIGNNSYDWKNVYKQVEKFINKRQTDEDKMNMWQNEQ